MKIQRSLGFTLFEILVAVSIFAIIGAMTMANLIQVGRTGEKVSDAQRQLAQVQFALGYFGRDIIQLVDRKIRDQFGDEQPQLKVAENTLVFTRSGWSNLLGQPRSNLQRVEYRLQDDKLQRRYWPQLDQAYSDVNVEQDLLTGVEDFSITLLSAGEEKFDIWPVQFDTTAPVKPVAIELKIELKGFGQIRRVYELADVLL